MICRGNFKEINVKFKNGSLHLLEGTQSLDNAAKIQDIIREGQYQNIEIKQENHKVVSFKRTIRKMIE